MQKTADNELPAIAQEAYLYGFPMVVGYQVIHGFFIDRSSGQFKAPINKINNEARVFTPEDTGISTPNSDTPYSMALLDLRAEPMVLGMPAIEKERYYDVQLVDLYTNNYGYMGSRATGNGAGRYLVAGPDWDGDTPSGIDKAFRCETQFSLVVYRTQLFNPADMENVKKIQAGYELQALSAFLGQPAPPAAPAIDWPHATPDAFSTRFAEYLDFLLQFCPAKGAAEVEKSLRARFARIGIGAGKGGEALSPEVKAALGEGAKAAMAKIEETTGKVGVRVNGWQIGSAAGSRSFYDGNWALRAAAAKLGIYGNSEAEAVYPFTRQDANGMALDGSKHAYRMTFAPGDLPPVKAFWSITMYDGVTQFLIGNPIDRYLVNSPMLPQLETNPDGSLTLYIQKDSPGKDKESNWLPAPDGPMFLAMRLYWPETEEAPSSVFPLGKGSWSPPGIVPVRNLRALGVKRFGDMSLESIVRTDTRHGHDGLFQGPRGWAYWNHLECPRPIQNPNLWPDGHSTYFMGRLVMPAGSSLTLRCSFPHSRYFQFALYTWDGKTFVSTGEALAGKDIEPDSGSTNPYRVGANRLAEPRNFTLVYRATDEPKAASERAQNTLYVGADGAELMFGVRIYLSDQGWDGAGWGLASSPSFEGGLPTYEGELADGTKLSAAEVVAQFGRAMDATSQPLTAAQWGALIHAKGNDPTLDPATAPARENPRWEKYWNFAYSIAGAFKTAQERAQIPTAGAIDGGGDPTTQYMFLHLSRKFGAVYVMRGKMPIFPDTYAGVGGKGLEVMPDAQTQYWSLVSCEAAPSGQIVDALYDMQVPLDTDRNYTIVYSRREDRPENATTENGVAWIEWSPRGEGIQGPNNRTDFGMLMMRIMATNPGWVERPDNVMEPGKEETVMGPYYPHGEYTDKASFEATGLKRK